MRRSELDPKFANAYRRRGLIYFGKGDKDHALADYEAAIRSDPNDGYAYYSRGDFYSDKGDKDRARADYQMALRLIPANDRLNAEVVSKIAALQTASVAPAVQAGASRLPPRRTSLLSLRPQAQPRMRGGGSRW